MKIKLDIDISNEDYSKLIAGKSIECTCNLNMEQSKEKQAVLCNPSEVDDIIDHWNNHEVINLPHIVRERKHAKYIKHSAPYDKKIFDKALSKFSKDEIIEKMDKYLSRCANGDHVFDGRNIGYGNVTGFLKGISSTKQLWWEGEDMPAIKDEDPEGTLHIADCFAKYFLKRKTFGLEEGTRSHKTFIEANKIITRTYNKVPQHIDLTKDKYLKHLFKCIEDKFDEVFPGHLISDTVWKVMFPKYINDNIL